MNVNFGINAFATLIAGMTDLLAEFNSVIPHRNSATVNLLSAVAPIFA